MSAILHIGLPRTGTTSIQKWLGKNWQPLRRVGIALSPMHIAHRVAVEHLPEVFRDRPDIVALRDALTFDQALTALGQTEFPAIIASSEYFFLSKPGSLEESLRSAGIGVDKVICYLRRQDRLCASSYSQDVRYLNISAPILYAEYDPQLDWSALHDRWAAAFPEARIVLRDYDRAAAFGLIESFKRALDIEIADEVRLEERLNASTSARITEIARMLNERTIPFDPDVLSAFATVDGTPPFAFSQAITAMFERAFIASNQDLARRFPEEFPSYRETDWMPDGVDRTDMVDEASMYETLAAIQPEHP